MTDDLVREWNCVILSDGQRIYQFLPVPERIRSAEGEGAAEETGFGRFQDAADLVGRVHRAVQKAQLPEPSRATDGERWSEWKRLNFGIRQVEQRHLRPWAAERGMLLQSLEFEREHSLQSNIAGEPLGGLEHDIYFTESEVVKRWRAALDPMVTSYFAYFNRMVIHNYLFPETAYRLRGFVEVEATIEVEGADACSDFVEETVLMPIVVQPKISIDTVHKVTPQETDGLMVGQFGFQSAGRHAYLSRDGRIEVSDLHDANIVRGTDANIYVIDNDVNVLPGQSGL